MLQPYIMLITDASTYEYAVPEVGVGGPLLPPNLSPAYAPDSLHSSRSSRNGKKVNSNDTLII